MSHLDGKVWDTSIWNREITEEEYAALGVTSPRGISFAKWFCENFHKGDCLCCGEAKLLGGSGDSPEF